MTRARLSRRNTFIATGTDPDARGSLPVAVELEITDYKGDLPLNPVAWCKLVMTTIKTASDGRRITRRIPIILDARDRETLLRYLQAH